MTELLNDPAWMGHIAIMPTIIALNWIGDFWETWAAVYRGGK